MNTFTHLGISVRIMDALREKMNIQLNRAGFMLGNIKPDLSPRLIAIPHFKEDAIGFIQSEIKKLINTKINPYTECTREFSENLGIIIHYVSDFFCHVHSQYFKGNQFSHHLYEMNLSNYCRENSKKINTYLFEKFKLMKPDSSSICKYLDDLHNEYIQSFSCPSYETDMKFALGVTTSLCFNLVSACISGYEESVA